MPVASTTQPVPKLHGIVVVVYLYWSGATAALTRRRHLMKQTVPCAPPDIANFAGFADRVSVIPALFFGVEVFPYLVVSALAAEASSSRGVVLEKPPAHFLFKTIVIVACETHGVG